MADIERFEKYGLDGEPEHLRQARGAGATDSHYHAYVTAFVVISICSFPVGYVLSL